MALPTPRINSFAFPSHFVHWETVKPLVYPTRQVTIYHQDGVDDWGALIGSKRADAGVIETDYHATTPSDGDAVLRQYVDLVGTLVNVTDEYNRQWRSALLVAIEQRPILPVLTPAQRYSVQLRWFILPSVSA